MINTLFIVWRESVEAMLVIGILYAWLGKNDETGRGLRYLYGGIGTGLGFAGLLAWAMLAVQSELSGQGLEYFQIGMVFAAAILITQMVLWMRQHGRHLKRELETGAARAAAGANWFGLLAVAAIAVAREGAETVVFLYGIALERHGFAVLEFAAAAAAGLGLALLSFWLLAAGGRYFSWRVFFRFSEAVLLLLASALLVNGAEKLIGSGVLPALVDPVWDTSFLLDDASRAGGLIAALTGYRAQPALLLVFAYGAYWALVWLLMRWQRQPALKPA
ncbi:MAG: FTR1 family protein [Sulfuricaulis sp.]|uniref:FTR1 family iron permease n=1 Tax=Sulfuricaulis sp. TaxID=2003553 RepID=UPI0025D16122|nr:FTR1 family protein [Sulfuricaulis sp.]MCR4346352.1 FTR1 family protein [Sulfuricaulis sp.]